MENDDDDGNEFDKVIGTGKQPALELISGLKIS